MQRPSFMQFINTANLSLGCHLNRTAVPYIGAACHPKHESEGGYDMKKCHNIDGMSVKGSHLHVLHNVDRLRLPANARRRARLQTSFINYLRQVR